MKTHKISVVDGLCVTVVVSACVIFTLSVRRAQWERQHVIAAVTISGQSWNVIDNGTLRGPMGMLVLKENGKLVERDFPLYTPYAADTPASLEESRVWKKYFGKV
ncbi:MAG: hypothetical protein KGI41_00805 [Patescibacteria group bacterium]|nr:hypothetical protein [Patescibacteria group bacterium]MDE1965768.1 hypothetical protein [Patescibacteria group bacterium]